MEYLVIFIIIMIVILLIINGSHFGVSKIPINPLKNRKNKKKRNKKKVSFLKESEISSISKSTKKEKIPKSNIVKTNELYYLDGSKKSQVYHVFNNVYTFSDAKNKCISNNARLATPKELKEVYDNGAYWCNWGWTSDGHAYLPNKEQSCNKTIGLLKGDKLDPYLKLGVNCYGKPYE